MKTTTTQASKLMDILAELYCNAYVSINGEPNIFELPKLTDRVKVSGYGPAALKQLNIRAIVNKL